MEEKTVNEEIMETTIGDDKYLIVPADEYEICDYDEDESEGGDFKSMAAGAVMGAGVILLGGLAVKGIKKLVHHFKNKKQSSNDGDYTVPVGKVKVNTTDVEIVEIVDEDFDDSDLTEKKK